MAKIITYKCDICGKESKSFFDNAGSIKIRYGNSNFVDAYNELCPECMHKIEDYIMSLRLQKDCPGITVETLKEMDKIIAEIAAEKNQNE